MYNRFITFIFASLTAVLFTACSSDKQEDGSTTIKHDLRVSSISVDIGDFSPVFSPDSAGPYNFTVEQGVEEVTLTIGELNDSAVRMDVYRQVTPTQSNRIGRENNVADPEPNTPFSLPLTQGQNTIVVHTRTPDNSQHFRYTLKIYRVSNEAKLAGISFYSVFANGTGNRPDWPDISYVKPEAFDPDVYEYEMSAPYNLCTEGIQPFTTDRGARVKINGEQVVSSYTYFDLAVGETSTSVEVVSQDGTNTQTYTFKITRQQPTQQQLDNDFTLSSMTVEPSVQFGSNGVGEGFYCLSRVYAAVINNDQDSVALTAIPSVAGRSMVLAEYLSAEEAGGEPTLVGTTPIEADVPVTIDVPRPDPSASPLPSTFYAVSLDNDDDGKPISHYIIDIDRLTTNRVLVASAEALQQALQNAKPNDEIVITQAALSGDAGVEKSGMDGVVFYGKGNGTEEQPIILRSSSNLGSALSSSEEGQHTVLQISGDYWTVSRIGAANGAVGIVLDGVTKSNFSEVVANNLSQQGIVLRNGSESNVFSRLAVMDIGSAAVAGSDSGEALVIGSHHSQWTTAPVPAPSGSPAPVAEPKYLPNNANNVFSEVVLGPRVKGELVDIKEGVDNTLLTNGVFDSTHTSDVAEYPASVIVKGNNTTIAYNTLVHPVADSIQSVVYVTDIDSDWVTEPWGEDSEVFDNILDLSGLTGISAVAANDNVASVLVHDNVRNDGGEISYSGSAIDQGFVSPHYQIQLVADETKCLQREMVTVTNSADVPLEDKELMILASDCSDALSQRWNFVNDEGGYLLLRSSEDSSVKLAARTGAPSYIRNASGIPVLYRDFMTTVPDVDDGFDQAFFLRWKVRFLFEDQVVFVNKSDPTVALSMIPSANLSSNLKYVTEKDVLAGVTLFNSVEQRFKLIRVAAP